MRKIPECRNSCRKVLIKEKCKVHFEVGWEIGTTLLLTGGPFSSQIAAGLKLFLKLMIRTFKLLYLLPNGIGKKSG